MRTAFRKMHGLGNDFVVIDARDQDILIDADRARAISDRRRGVGCDQLIILRGGGDADVVMDIWNADGSQVGACGNATRCVGDLLLSKAQDARLVIQTLGGRLEARRAGSAITVNMGPALLAAEDVPLRDTVDTLSVDLGMSSLPPAVCSSMGNPHATFFVGDPDAVDIASLGPKVEHHPMFPERVNVGFASVSGATIRLRVWERGAGITQACGTAACAAVVAASRTGKMVGRKASVTLDGGDLQIAWTDSGDVMMTGPVATSFTGELSL